MSKTRQKNKSETEFFRGIIRELEKEIRSLQKQLRQYEKYDRSQEDNYLSDSEDTYPDIEFKQQMDCPSCGKGKVVETLNLGHRGIFGECNCCGFRGKIV